MNKRTEGGLTYIFQRIAAGAPDDLSLTQGGRKHEAREWYRRKASEISSVNAPNLIRRAEQNRKFSIVTSNNIGQMLLFKYDAKLKKELPYWDMMPLIFPIEIYQDGFLGINLHYLPPVFRARLMDALYTVLSNNKYDKTTRLQLSYQILKGAKKFKYFKPCTKRYLHDHVQSNLIAIDPTEWDMALMLPIERFQKARKQTVWSDSVKSVRGK